MQTIHSLLQDDLCDDTKRSNYHGPKHPFLSPSNQTASFD